MSNPIRQTRPLTAGILGSLLGLCLWAVSIHALEKPVERRWVILDDSHLPDTEVTAVAVDFTGDKWFGTRKGLVRYRNNDWETFTFESRSDALGANYITVLEVDAEGALWVGTDGGGVSMHHNGVWTRFTKENTGLGLPDNSVWAIAFGRSQERWFGTRKGFAVMRGSVWKSYTQEQISGRLPDFWVLSIAVDDRNRTWLGTSAGLVRFSNASWITMLPENTGGKLPHPTITALRFDENDKSLWVGTYRGLARYRNNQWEDYSQVPGLGETKGERVYDIARSPDLPDQTWFAIRGGAARLMGGNWTLFTKASTEGGIPTRFVNAIAFEQDGSIWFGSKEGVTTWMPK